MRIHLSIMFLVLICNLFYKSINAQVSPDEWFSVGTQWTYVEVGINDPAKQILVQVTRDTIIEGVECRIVEILTEDSFFPELVPEIILYPTEDVVYQYAEGAFHVLYDFTVQAGDTIEVYVPYGEVNGSNRHQELVDSTKVLNIDGKAFRAYWTSFIDENSSWNHNYDFPIIERIGGTGFLVPEDQLSEVTRGPMTYFQDDCITVRIKNISCIATTCEYNLTDLNCELASPLFENIAQKSFKLYPNPACKQIILDHSYSEILSYTIYDLSGRQMKLQHLKTRENVAINVSSLNNGIYVLQVITADGIISKHFVVQQ